MAKFRSNYNRKSGAGSGVMILRVGLFAMVIGILYFAFRKYAEGEFDFSKEELVSTDVSDFEQTGLDSIFFLPSNSKGELIRHQFYALSYVEEYELAEWVAYELTSERLRGKWVKRTNDFRPDSKVISGSSTLDDYRGSSFDKGHLASAADMAFSVEAMSESFLMSNMAPQEPGFNKGVWRELEELTRDWAKRFKHLYVVTGPVLNKLEQGRIGKNEVAVPQAFYKVLLDLTEPELKGIGFLIPNRMTEERLEKYATSIDEVEKFTGLNFFPNLLEIKLEEQLESNFNMKLWKTNEKKYELRVKYWNKN